jgi:hypothetical protein
MIVSAIRPPASPTRMDSVGNPGIGDRGIDVVAKIVIDCSAAWNKSPQCSIPSQHGRQRVGAGSNGPASLCARQPQLIGP